MSIAAISEILGLTWCIWIELVEPWTLHFFRKKLVSEIQVSSILTSLLPLKSYSIIIWANCYLSMRFLSELPLYEINLTFLYLIPIWSFITWQTCLLVTSSWWSSNTLCFTTDDFKICCSLDKMFSAVSAISLSLC